MGDLMAHYAELDGSSQVVRVVVVHNAVTTTGDTEDEQAGIDFLTGLFPGSGPWVQTSYNGNQRGKFAAVGDIYDQADDVFHGPQPWPSWTLDDNHTWQPPTPHPGIVGGKLQKWDEATRTWVDGDA